MIRVFYKTFLLVIFFGLLACGNQDKPEEIMSEEEASLPTVEETRFNAQNVFNSLPDRRLVMKLIKENKIEYNPDLMNDPTRVKKYTVEFSRAINLGVYGSDLSISSSFDQTQESMVFLKCVNVLAQSLGVSGAFDQRLFERIEANSSNKDSIIEIVTEAFKKVDEILKYNNRPSTSAIILSGCWIEGLYVSCKMGTEVNQENVIKAIIAQEESLKNLIVMLEAVKPEPEYDFLLKDLHRLHEAFEAAEKTEKFDKHAIENISAIVNDLRARITSTSDI